MTREDFIQQAAIAIAASLSAVHAEGEGGDKSILYTPEFVANESKRRATVLANTFRLQPSEPYINRGPG